MKKYRHEQVMKLFKFSEYSKFHLLKYMEISFINETL